MYGSDMPLHWDPLTATVEVWGGDSLDRMQFIANSLREVGIPSRTLTEDSRNLRLLVRPEDETNAREVVRQILEAAAPEHSVARSEDVWYDEPVRSYLWAWLPGVLYIAILFLVYAMEAGPDEILSKYSRLDPLFSVIKFADEIASLWMLYQAIRYEIRPLRFVLLSGLPFSFVWYYFERYSRRVGRQRLPIAVRERMAPRPSA